MGGVSERLRPEGCPERVKRQGKGDGLVDNKLNFGGVSERLKETVLKTVVAKSHREFESRPLRRIFKISARGGYFGNYCGGVF